MVCDYLRLSRWIATIFDYLGVDPYLMHARSALGAVRRQIVSDI